MFPVMRINLTKKSSRAQFYILKLVDFARNSSTSSDYFGKRLKGKVALTTASTDGIGFAIAKRFAIEGAKVVVSSRKAENVEKAVQALKDDGHDALGLTCRISHEDERIKLVESTIEKYGAIDIFVNNVGINPISLPLSHPKAGGVLDCTEQVWDKVFEVNLKNTWQMTKLIVPHMTKRKTGCIIYNSSLAAFNLTHPMVHTYSVSKLAVLGLVKALTIELADYDIRVNSICPGPIATRFIQGIIDTGEAYKDYVYSIPQFNRIGKVEEVSGVAAFLASDDGNFISGENIIVAGGARSRI